MPAVPTEIRRGHWIPVLCGAGNPTQVFYLSSGCSSEPSLQAGEHISLSICEIFFVFNYVNKGSVGISTQGIEFAVPEVIDWKKQKGQVLEAYT